MAWSVYIRAFRLVSVPLEIFQQGELNGFVFSVWEPKKEETGRR